MSAHLPHTVEMKKGPFMRLFLWTYNPNVASLNTCWLFWGFIFMILAVPIVSVWRFILRPILVPVVDWLDDIGQRRRIAARSEASAAPKVKKESEFLQNTSGFFSKLWFKLAPVWPWIGKVLLVAIVIGLIYLGVFVVDWSGFWDVLWEIALTLVGAVAAICVGLFLFWLLFDKWEVGRAVKSGGRAFHSHTCANIRFKDEPTDEDEVYEYGSA
jgi:hypothetical protein